MTDSASHVSSSDSGTREKISTLDEPNNEREEKQRLEESDDKNKQKFEEEEKQKFEEEEKQKFEEEEEDYGCMTQDQLRVYCEQVSASKGFDVPDFPSTEDFGRIMPLPGLYDDLKLLGIITDLSRLAIELYNHNNGSKYEFVHVVKSNVVGVAGSIYYITFEAKDGDDAQSKTFQAKVFRGLQLDVEVFSCDPKPT